MPFILRFSGNDAGAITFTGNTLGLSGSNGTPGTNDFIGALVTTNTALQVGNFPAGTTNDFNLDSASAILRLPPGSSILYAELLWAGTYAVTGGSTNLLPFIDKSVSVTTPLGTTVSVAPDAVTAQQLFINDNFNYFRSANVTSLIQAAGAGTYTVGGVVGNTENVGISSGNQCGWTLCVVYENPTLPFRNMSLNVGIVDIQFMGSSPVTTTITGFGTPVSGPVTGRMQLCTGDGDANKTGDNVLFGPTPANLTFLSGPNNVIGNFFASQINDDAGNLDTSGTFGLRNMLNGNPGTNVVAGRQGWDITNVDISSTLTNNQTSATFQLQTVSEGYSVYAVGIYIDINAPIITVVKSADRSEATVGDTVTYQVVVQNTGLVSVNPTSVFDSLPNDTSFVPGSATINGAAAPIGTNPATGIPVGMIAPGLSATVTFQVVVTSVPATNEIVNRSTAVFQYQSVAGGPLLDGSIPSNEVVIDVPGTPLLSLIKTADPTSAAPGEAVTYTFNVINPGNVTLTNVQITDSSLGLIDTLSSLPPGATVILTAKFTIPAGTPAGTVITNTGMAVSNETGPVTDIAQVAVLSGFGLAVAKSASQLSAAPGEIVNYTITVTNTSNAPITNVHVNDNLLGFTHIIPSLAAEASQSFIVPFTIPEGTTAGTVITNVTTATSNETPPASDTATIIVAPIPNVFIFKTVHPQTGAPGENVTYTITVTNAGNQTLTNVRIVDPTLGIDETFDALKPGDSIEIQLPFTIPLTAMQGETLPNIATVTTDQTGPESANAVITVIGIPDITLVKSVSPTAAPVGGTVTYAFVITNTGSTLLTNVRLTDPLLGLNQTVGTLAPGQSQKVDFPFVVPQAASDPFINFATASGTSGAQTVQASDEAAFGLLIPSFTLTKTVDRAQANPGDTVQFTLTIINTGGIPLTNVVVVDPLLAFTNTIAALEPGASFAETLPFVVPADALPGSVIPNIVIVSSTESGPQEATDTVTVNQVPAISLTKVPDVVNALPGDTITYTLTVTNTGNIPLTSVGVGDDLLGLTAVIPSLAVGQSQSFTATFLVPPGTPAGTVITNISTAVSDETESIEAIANVLINALPPAITIVKTPNRLTAAPGDVVTYTITVTNPSTVTLTDVVLQDETLGIAQALGTLTPGQSQTLTFFFTIPAGTPNGTVIVNTAVVTSDQTNPEEGTSIVTVDPQAGLTIAKTIDPAQAAPGQTVTATISIRNTGNIALTNVILSDPTLNFSSVIPSLPAGSTEDIQIPFVIPNVAAGSVLFNTATVSSDETDPASSTATVTVLPRFQLSLTKSVSPSAAVSGETVTFTFIVRNDSNAELTDLRFTDELLGIDKTVDVIPAGFFITLSRTFTIPEGTRGGTVILNTAVLTSAETDPVTATAEVTVPERPALTISKTVFPPIAIPGEVVLFRMQGVNSGNVPLVNIRYADPLLGIVGTVASQDVGESLSLIIPFTVPADATPGETIVNTVLVNSAQTGPLSASASVKVAEFPLVVTKRAEDEVVFVGDTFGFTITVANRSTITVNRIVLTDALQASTRFIPNNVTVGGKAVPGADPASGIPLGNLAPGQSVDIVFQAEQTAMPPEGILRNQAVAAFQPADSLQRFKALSNLLVLPVENHEE